MKTKFKIAVIISSFTAALYGQQIQNLVSVPATNYDVVRVKGNLHPNGVDTLNRLGHLESGTWNNGTSKWASIGRPIQSATGNAPNSPAYYGLCVNDDSDRAFFGTRRRGSNGVQTIIAWGDDDSTFTPGYTYTDRLMFEFHNPNNTTTPIMNALTMMPRNSNGVYVGIGSSSPTEQLHTTKGVRFEGVITGGTPTELVSIDGNGKLWRSAFPSVLGNPCSAAANPLGGHYEVPMNNSNFNFTMPNNSTSQVLIGNTSCVTGAARLDVTDDFVGTGVQGFCSTNSQNNFGMHGLAVDPLNNSGIASIGVLGETERINNGNYSAGVAGFCAGPANVSMLPAGQDVGVYGNSRLHNGTWAGYFDGDVNFNGQVFGSQFAWTSDRRFKNNIKGLENASQKLKQLKGYTYTFNTTDFAGRNFPQGEQIGLIAQELKEVFPQLVTEDKQGYLAVNYVGLIPVMLEAIKEQGKTIDQQAQINSDLQKQLDEQKQLIGKMSAIGINSNGGIETGFQMSQNEPNPFTHETIVKYTLPQSISSAFMAVYDLTGKQIATFPITEKGSASITITSEKLSAGIYIYSIVADGKVVDSKRMIVAEK